MEGIFILLFVILFICLALSGYYIYTLRKSFDDRTDKKLKEIVKEINDSNFYAFNFDKQQEGNLKNMESNVKSLYNSYLLMKDSITKLKGDAVSKDKVKDNVTTDKAFIKNLYVGPFSFTSKGSADGTDWLYMYNGGKFGGGLGVKNFSAEKSTLDDVIINKQLNVKGNVDMKGTLNLSADNGVCLGKVCIIENNGVLQACNKAYSNCKKINVS